LKSYGFIFNPASNRSRSGKALDTIYDFIKQHDLEASVLVINPQDRIIDVAARAAEDHDVVVACGGDGTISATAAGLLGSDAALGILPIGSGNDFVKSLRIPRTLKGALQVLIEYKMRRIDIGKVNDHYFVNTLGIGFDGETNRRTRECTWLKGSPMYVWAALKSNFHFQPQPFTLRFNDRTLSQDFLMITVANGKVEGGHFTIAPQASVSDGLFDVLTLDPISKWILPIHLLRFMNGSHLSLKQVHLDQTDRLTIEHHGDEIPVHADGEQITLEFPLDIQLLKGAVPVLCPPM
jgi:diacylglycerol kinase (ATP)